MLDLTDSIFAEPAISSIDSLADPSHPMIGHLWRERTAVADWLIDLTPGGSLLGAARGRRGAAAPPLAYARPAARSSIASVAADIKENSSAPPKSGLLSGVLLCESCSCGGAIRNDRRTAMLRSLFAILLVAFPAPALRLPRGPPRPAEAWRHGASLLGDLKYPAGFAHFDYVDPDAPKGGSVRLSAAGSFDSFNVVPSKGVVATGLGYLYQSLMAPALDEASTQYGEIAEAVRFPADFSSATYRLNPKARWHDGKPVTADDVVWSFEVLKANNPQQAYYYKNVVKAEASGRSEVTFTFDKAGNRELPQIIGQLLVLPKHWWTGTDRERQAARHHRDDAGAAARLGPLPHQELRARPQHRPTSGSRIGGAPTCRPPSGTYNFDEMRFEYFLDRDVMREAFKGDAYDFRVENIAKDWATSYDVPAVREGRIVKQEFPDDVERPRCRPSPSICAARSSATRACAAPSTKPSTSRR